VPVEVDANDDAGQSFRYYARRQGRYTKCCIYVSEQDLLPQIDGFEDAEYMAFDSWEDARRYVTSTCTLQVLPTTEPIMQTYDAAIGNSSSSNNVTDTDVDVDDDTMPAGCPPMPPLPALGEVDAYVVPVDVPALVHVLMDNMSTNISTETLQSDYTNEWELRYSELVKFQSDFGTSDVPSHSQLGHFAARQRIEYAAFVAGIQNCLTQERVDRLKTLDLCFGGHGHRKTFGRYVDELISYRNKNGCDPASGSNLSKWIWNRMEKRYLEFKRGKTSVVGMDATKCEALERFGFDWTENVATAESEAEAVEAPAPAAMDMGMGVSPSAGTMGGIIYC